ncbi:MAG: twin-arginine translocase subunit TatC [Chloroflexi bacterium]|nr:twin-arginine translocase subunit TatC [Ktedonobacteraceae bacterium]MBV8821546.1 twin-arginine translocase subunit TatC [Ktedonobacteraceae bacterium]MBV9021961.1 twin-arginine translocase subunit TatC [Ktedonobacteraceae bacterium]MBV9707840.1 twin-arginine translocase subunit TatC [Chloroflexota bacterium]
MATGDIDQQDSMLDFDNYRFQPEEDDSSSMSLVDHLEELRWRIFKSLIAIVVGAIIAFIFRDYIIHFLAAPLPQGADLPITHGKLVVTGITEGFTTYLLVSLAVGVVIALPVILYQTWAFVAPGLYPREKKYAVPFIFLGLLLFVVGVSLGYIVLRYPVEFLVTFAAGTFSELITAQSYFTFVAFFVLAFGLVFELPLVLTFMAQVGLITSDTLKRKRASSHIGMWVAATFLTPGADIYSPIILGVAMSFLYELTIVFIRIFTKK